MDLWIYPWLGMAGEGVSDCLGSSFVRLLRGFWILPRGNGCTGPRRGGVWVFPAQLYIEEEKEEEYSSGHRCRRCCTLLHLSVRSEKFSRLVNLPELRARQAQKSCVGRRLNLAHSFGRMRVFGPVPGFGVTIRYGEWWTTSELSRRSRIFDLDSPSASWPHT